MATCLYLSLYHMGQKDVTMEELWDIYASCFLFKGLNAPEELPDQAEICECKTAESVFPAERQGLYMGIMVSGRAEVRQKGDSNIIMSILGRGDEFGAASLYSGMDFMKDIVAVGECRVLYISKAHIDDLMADRRIARNFIAYLSQRIHFLNGRIECFTSGSVLCSLAMYLADSADKAAATTDGRDGALESRPDFALPCSISRLADVLHVGRASLYRALDDLSRQGVIYRNNRYIHILDKDKLYEIGGIR